MEPRQLEYVVAVAEVGLGGRLVARNTIALDDLRERALVSQARGMPPEVHPDWGVGPS